MNVAAKPRAQAVAQGPAELTAYLRECITAGIPRFAVLLRLALLPAELARPHHRRLAREALAPLAVLDRARLFELGNGDLVVVWRGAAPGAVRMVVTDITHLFADTDAALDPALLAVPLTLPAQADVLLDAVEIGQAPRRATSVAPKAPLDAATLTRLEECLIGADVARFARRKGIYERHDEDDRLALRWEKRFLSVGELAQALIPDHSPQADMWLFRRLTRSLDRRMLALLAAPDELRDAGPFSLNLNVASILSPEFLRFDAALLPRLRGCVTIDLQPADVMADPAAFMFARDFAHARGYRLLLRGVGADLLGMFDQDRLGVDWIQLRWSPALARLDAGALRADPARCVLARAFGREALAWGHANGVRHFQRALNQPPGR